MKKHIKFLLVSLAILTVLIAFGVALTTTNNARAQEQAPMPQELWAEVCPFGYKVVVNPDEDTLINAVSCVSEEVIPEPTPTEPTPTVTVVPPTPTPTQGETEPYPGAPACDHTGMERVFHTLWDSARGCHYDHTHGDNPHELDGLFGTVVFDLAGGEISYPWHTPGENAEVKHKSYVWLVGKDLGCENPYGDGCITDYRAFVHNDLHNVFSSHHTALVEAKICNKNDLTQCGYMLVSGHQAAGDLFIDGQVVIDRPEPNNSPRPQLLHYDQIGNRNFATWYPAFYGWMRVSTEVGDMFGYYPFPTSPIPLANPDELEFVRLSGNASDIQPHVISVGLPGRYISAFDADGDGFANYIGFINVHTGVPGEDCVGISEMCAPLIMDNFPILPGVIQYRGEHKDYDIFFDGQSAGWIEFPGFAPPRP